VVVVVVVVVVVTRPPAHATTCIKAKTIACAYNNRLLYLSFPVRYFNAKVKLYACFRTYYLVMMGLKPYVPQLSPGVCFYIDLLISTYRRCNTITPYIENSNFSGETKNCITF